MKILRLYKIGVKTKDDEVKKITFAIAKKANSDIYSVKTNFKFPIEDDCNEAVQIKAGSRLDAIYKVIDVEIPGNKGICGISQISL